MGRMEREGVATDARRADAAQHESDHHRWADDGGFIPEPVVVQPEAGIKALVRTPWAMLAVCATLGFAVGWLTGRRQP